MRIWTLHPDCKTLVQDKWNMNVIGCPMFILSTKIKTLKEKFKTWNKEVFGNVHEFVKNAEQNLQQVQEHIQLNGNFGTLLEAEKFAHKAFEDVLNKELDFWQKKARLNWYLEGDRNTKYFLRLAQIKSTTKKITSLQDDEQVLTDQSQIVDHIITYYKNLFCTNFVLQDQLLAEEVIPNLITTETNVMITMLPSHEEIKAVVFSLNKDSAPVPDGFGAYFFQLYWNIVKEDVQYAVLEFFTTSWILPGFNANIISLLPKVDNAISIYQYRPITNSNFKFKIISKIIVDMLASVLPSIISQEQMGSIHDRNIKDCLCTASKAANLHDNKSYGGNLAINIDITKAFDTLEWLFLLKVLKKFVFNDEFCKWIQAILQSSFLSVSISKSHGYFYCIRGVRQGDPLSPLLFCLTGDVLSRSISKLLGDSKLERIKGTINVLLP